MKIANERGLQQIASNNSSNTVLKELMKLYKNHTKKPYSFLVNETSLQSTYYNMTVTEKTKTINHKIDMKINTIYIDKQLIFRLFHREILVI